MDASISVFWNLSRLRFEPVSCHRLLFHSAATDQLSQSSKRRFPSGYWFVLGWLMYLRVVTLHLWFSTQFRRERDQSARIVKSRRTPFLSDLRVRLRLGRTHEVLALRREDACTTCSNSLHSLNCPECVHLSSAPRVYHGSVHLHLTPSTCTLTGAWESTHPGAPSTATP